MDCGWHAETQVDFRLNDSSSGYGVKKYMEEKYSPGKKMPAGLSRKFHHCQMKTNS